MAKHDEGFKLRAVEQCIRGRASYREAGSAYGIEARPLRRWVAGYRLHGQAGLARKAAHYSAPSKQEAPDPLT
ncbi:helix-turn-helix domain-containing protein [Bordetella trematum]|uniref:helix-turn-helix domain-containing protein n=1 Tax=Bordetella trematum TaxID=123899 RepID=UPI0039890D82